MYSSAGSTAPRELGVGFAPGARLVDPDLGDFAQHREPGARVLAALVVVRGGGQHAVRPFAGAISHAAMELVERQAMRDASKPTSLRDSSTP